MLGCPGARRGMGGAGIMREERGLPSGRETMPRRRPLGSSVQSLSCVWLCDPMDCSAPGFPVLHYLPEFAETHVHWVDDAIQPSYSLSSPSPPAFSLSQHQGLSQWVSSLHQVGLVCSFSSSLRYKFRLLNWFPPLMCAFIIVNFPLRTSFAISYNFVTCVSIFICLKTNENF